MLVMFGVMPVSRSAHVYYVSSTNRYKQQTRDIFTNILYVIDVTFLTYEM